MPPTSLDYSIEDWLPYRLWRLSRSAGDELEAYYSEAFGLDGSDWRTLAILANYAPISAKALAETLDISQVQMTRALTKLQELGLLSRRTDREDKRKVVLQLNRKGKAIYQKIAPRAPSSKSSILTDDFLPPCRPNPYMILGWPALNDHLHIAWKLVKSWNNI